MPRYGLRYVHEDGRYFTYSLFADDEASAVAEAEAQFDDDAAIHHMGVREGLELPPSEWSID
jgi:hypothetical protein